MRSQQILNLSPNFEIQPKQRLGGNWKLSENLVLFNDRHDIQWSFYHDPNWDHENPVLVGQMVFEGKPFDGPIPYWRGIHWIRGENPPVWFEVFEGFPISRETAVLIAPHAFDPATPLREIVWDEEHIEGLIEGSYPPPIPIRFDGKLELIELSERRRRGLEMFWKYQDAVSANEVLSLSVSQSISWLRNFSHDELADFYFCTIGIYDSEKPGFRKDREDFREKVHRTLMSAFKFHLGSNVSD